jgi:hypothetical protein
MRPIMTLPEVKTFLQEVLGTEARRAFDDGLSELLCYVKSEALKNTEFSDEVMQKKFEAACKVMVVDSLKVFLYQRHATDDGKFNINYDGNVVYDKNFSPIPEVLKIRQRHQEVIDALMAAIMDDYHRGRTLFASIVSRIPDYKPRKDRFNKPLAYLSIQRTPGEVLEIEIMRLEGRLPNLTVEEGNLLSSLYRKLRYGE